MTNRILSIFASFLILLSITVVPAVAAPSGLKIFENDFFTTSGDEYVQGEFIVKFKPDVGKNEIAEINSKNGASIKRASPHFMMMNVPQGRTVSQMVESYSRNPNVEYAEANYIAHTHMTPNDPSYGLQWHLDTSEDDLTLHGANGGGINIEPAWDIATGTGVIVAVIDTGVAYEDYTETTYNPAGKPRQVITYAQAPDLANTDFVAGYDFVNNDEHPNDDEGHGTHVAGTIAQSTNNVIGVAGVAFDSSIMPIKVLDKSGSGTHDWIAYGIYYAADNGAQVISMSLGGTSPSSTLENALAYAHGKGVTIVCSAGNGGAGALPSYPAAYDDYCIAVGATRYDETVSYYSTTGDYVDIAAPGGDVTVDQNEDDYGDGVLQQTHNGIDYTTFSYYFYQGTSMAAPHVSGVAALLISNGVTGPDNIRDAMESTAEDKGLMGWDSGYGYGIVDAYAALQFTQGPAAPIANAGLDQTLNDADNNTEETVTLDASASYDPDGSIVTYEWKEGETVLGNTEVIDHNFNVGMHTVTLTVTDNATLTNTDDVIITVEANQAPIANAGPDQTVLVNENVIFDGSGSSDLGGIIVSYEWNLGDGTTATGQTVDSNYSTAGNYTVTLTVTDNGGAIDSDTTVVTVTEEPIIEEPTNLMFIDSITMDSGSKTAGRNTFTFALATVTVVDSNREPVQYAIVSGSWSDATLDSDIGTTDASGIVTVQSDNIKGLEGTFTFTVNSIVLAGLEYAPSVPDYNSITITV